MSRIQVRVLIAMLVAIHLAMALLLNPTGLPGNVGPLQTRATLACIGALIAQPALLALWAALGPQTLVRRWSLVLAVLGCLTLAHQFAEVNNAGRAGQPGQTMQPLTWLVAFLVCQLVLWAPRRKFRWRIESIGGAGRLADSAGRQFSMAALLAAMAGLAVFLAALRWIQPASSFAEWPLHLMRVAAMGAVMALPGSLAILVVWLILMEGPRRRGRWFIAFFGLIVMTAVAAAVAVFGSPGEVGELVFVLLGTILCAAGSALVVRLCGYRLVRTVAAGETETDDVHEPLPAESARRRFSLAAAGMCLLLAALAAIVPWRVNLWQERAEVRDWVASGLNPAFAHGEVVQLHALAGTATRIGPATIARINACRHLQRLSLSGPMVTDDTLELLGGLPYLTRLSLVGARITDEGLRYLGKFRNLNSLDLRMTDVADDGLIALAGLRGLMTVDLGHTRVTPEGAAWLQAQRRGLSVSATTSDATLRELSHLLRERRTRMSEPESMPATFMVRAEGSAVTDGGLTALRGLTNVAELDLTDARLTNAAVDELGTLRGLKKLVVRGTGITDAGIDALRQKLPDCEIAR
jgi:hypothetical protein